MSDFASLGWDVGGAHLKRATFDRTGTLRAVDMVPCALWRGLDQLEAALDRLGTAPGRPSAVTMTGELVDLWPDRETGVKALAAALGERLGPDCLIYAGPDGLVPADTAGDHVAGISSANWHATAAALAHVMPCGILVDVGSTTTDLIPFSKGAVAARGFTDAERLATSELVYSGAVRTPVMALAPALPFAGHFVPLMAEVFATTADIYRLTGALPDHGDLHPSADGGPKTLEASARRLLRMVGRDLGPATLDEARLLAAYAAAVQLHTLHGALACVMSCAALPANAPLVGAGIGRFLAQHLAARVGRPYVDVGGVFTGDPALAPRAADCAPAVAVGALAFARGRVRLSLSNLA
ncbi:hydantoinase/oxoprolinase family protein [Xanthobacter sp. DSM 24535]|uniref:hydantoinase/oxoprolinase family protein n=1 Tax=Roseixanthobacter psychrophilus TaxID=3119917 RepID=UPI00372CB69E